MDIRNRRGLKSFAAERLQNAPNSKRIILIYTGMVLGVNVLSVLLSYVLGLRIDQATGLRNLSIRNTLSTVQSMLPILQSILVMCLDLGYVSTMLRTARGQYASPNGLRLGFERFWVLLRSQIILSLFYVGICFVCVYAASMIYMLTPMASETVELVTPLMSEASVLDPGIVLDDAAYARIVSSMTPAFVIFGVLYAALYIPVSYRFRMAKYVIIDRPGTGAIAALRESRMMMRGNAVNLFKLDVSLWWYHGALAVSSVICYGDQFLPMLGVEFPFSADVAYFIFYAAYWVIQTAVYIFLRSRVEVTYALAYDAIKPEEKKDGGVVLGNIFQM